MASEFFEETLERQLDRMLRQLPMSREEVPLDWPHETMKIISDLVDHEIKPYQDELDAADQEIAVLEEKLKGRAFEDKQTAYRAKAEGMKEGVVATYAEIIERLKRPENERRTGRAIANDLEKNIGPPPSK